MLPQFRRTRTLLASLACWSLLAACTTNNRQSDDTPVGDTRVERTLAIPYRGLLANASASRPPPPEPLMLDVVPPSACPPPDACHYGPGTLDPATGLCTYTLGPPPCTQYSIVDLGAVAASAGFPGTVQYDTASGINDSGQVAGGVATNNPYVIHGFLYDGSGMRDIGSSALAGSYNSGMAINGPGQVAMLLDRSGGGGGYIPGIYQPGTPAGTDPIKPYPLIAAPSPYQAVLPASYYPLAIDSAADVVGETSAPGPSSNIPYISTPFFSDGTTTISLGSLGGSRGGARGINDQGQIVGYSQTASTPQNQAYNLGHGFLYTSNGGMQDLNALLPGGSGWELRQANAINDSGQIVGFGQLLDPSSNTVVSRAYRYMNGQAQSLGLLPNGGIPEALAINPAGDVTGWDPYGGAWVYWDGPGMISLSALLSPADAHNWNLVFATGISTHGEIVGYGINNQFPGVWRAFLLKPVVHNERERAGFEPAGNGWVGSEPPVNWQVPNNLDDWRTPDCYACQRNCTTNPVILAGAPAGSIELCSAACLAPGQGCAEQVCNPSGGYATCDSNEGCCTAGGTSICCTGGTTCATVTDPYDPRSWPICCPPDNPVACGDIYQQACYPAGSSCCNGSACGPGYSCTTDSNGSPSCCPSAQSCGSSCCDLNTTCQQKSTGESVCCATPLCGDQCCTGDNCAADGTCCAGPLDSNGHCCGGFTTATVCNGQCCNGTCNPDGSCCQTGTTCGPPQQLTINAPNRANVSWTYTLSGTNNGAPIATWQWSVTNASGTTSSIGTGQSVPWTPTTTDLGNETLTLVATDVNGQQSTATAAVTVQYPAQ